MKPPGGRAPTKCRYLFSVLHVYYLDNCNVEHLGAGHMPSLQTALAIATPGQPLWYRILEMTNVVGNGGPVGLIVCTMTRHPPMKRYAHFARRPLKETCFSLFAMRNI